MFKMITNRGSGRTWNTCKYALEHNCDIIVAGYSADRACVRYLEALCEYYSGSYEYVEAIIGVKHCRVTIHDKKKDVDFTVNVYTDMSIKQNRADISASDKPIVVDDIDQCFKNILGIKNLAGITLGFDEYQLDK